MPNKMLEKKQHHINSVKPYWKLTPGGSAGMDHNPLLTIFEGNYHG